MSNFNYLRIVNLNYNNNTSKIDDQLFFLNGENTMINLKNGGGKTVLIQMIMAPFVRRKYRDLNERKFESYFTGKAPTYILVEWNLEDNAGYLLTGMMVRKKESYSDDDSKDTLDIINFVYEYKERNEYDIKSIPIIENLGEGRKIKSFVNSKKLFEDLKKNSKYNFNYYDMNNYTSSRAYFDKLREYGIDNKEWENIIKKVNLTESGLSQLFKESKNTEGLVKKWFLPTIEEKLNRDEDKINNYRNLIEGYIYQFKRNKSDIDRKNKIDIFKERAEVIKEAALEFKDEKNSYEEHKNKIANYVNALFNLSKEKERAILQVNEDILENDKEIRELKYEEISLNIYSNADIIKELENNISKSLELREEENREVLKLKRERNILACAAAYKKYTENSKRLQEIERKIEKLKSKGKDREPEINDLGYSIRTLLQEQYERVTKERDNCQLQQDRLLEEKIECIKKDKEYEKIINDTNKEEKTLYQEVKSFDIYENNFNRKYNEKFYRNIVGYFDDNERLSKGIEISCQKEKIESEKKKIEENIIKDDEILRAKTSEKESLHSKEYELKNKLDVTKEKIEEYHKELVKRSEIIKYINLDEDRIFYNEEILKLYDNKIEFLNSELKELYKNEDFLQKEISKLRSGKIIELPEDFIENLKNNDIEIIYGMEWLKKNGYSLEDNEEFVKNNPFIPYSLIMSKRDIEILKRTNIEVYTSFPIPIVERENLKDKIEREAVTLIDGEKVRFYISFNNKLLDEKELEQILELNEKKLLDLQDKIQHKKEAIDLYNNNKVYISNSTLTKEKYDLVSQSKIDIEKALKDNNEKIILIKELIAELEDRINENENKKGELKYTLKELENKERDYEELLFQYEIYCKSKDKYEELLKNKKLYIEKLEENKNKLEKLQEEIEETKEKLRDLQGQWKEYKEKVFEFRKYEKGNFKNKDLEDLLAEYRVLTTKLYEDIEELQQENKNRQKEYIESEKELIDKETEFNLKEEEFRDVIYNFSKEREVINYIEEREEKIKNIEKEISQYERDKALKELEISNLKKELIKLVNTDVPKVKDRVFNKNFKEEIAKLQIRKEKFIEERTNLEKELKQIDINKVSLDEYEFTILQEIEVDLNLNTLDENIRKLKRDCNRLKNSVEEWEKKLHALIMKVSSEDIFKSDSLFKDALVSMEQLYNNPVGLLEQLDMTIGSYVALVEKFMHDIDIINKEENNIITNLYEYILLVNENMEKIDENSTISIKGKSVKMLKISVVNIESNKDLYMLKIKEYVENIRDNCIKILEANESIKEYIENSINIVKLYNEIISIGNINIKLYKIEENKQKQITWDEVAKNSGGEGFLSAFVILSSLLSYMRKEDKDIFTRKEVSKVLIMDNPFAQTNAEHLLKPLIDISKKSRTQLICLTGLGGDSIINRFDNIYVLNLVTSKLRNGLKVIKSEHIVGEEERETIVASNVRSEDIQMKLF